MKTIESAEKLPRPRIAIVDYDMGNRASVKNALRAVGANPLVTRDPDELRNAAGVVLPGVGAFPAAMEKIRRYNLDKELSRVRLDGKPILGICLGHQLLFEASEEHEYTAGLGFLKGGVQKIVAGPGGLNIGWRKVVFTGETGLDKKLENDSAFYHLHSYAVIPEDDSIEFARSPYPLAKDDTDYAFVVSGVQSDNLYGVQFHPEKSSTEGLRLLRNFVEISGETQARL